MRPGVESECTVQMKRGENWQNVRVLAACDWSVSFRISFLSSLHLDQM